MPYDTETLPGGTRVFTAAHHRVGTDALLLARFCRFRPQDTACDLGSGCGILLLALADRGLRGESTGIELDAEGAGLLAAAAAANDYGFIRAEQGDLRRFKTGRPFHLLVANPPYFSTGQQPADPRRAAARHEQTATLEDFCAAAARLLRDGGRFCLCYPAAGLPRAMAALAAHSLAPKRLTLVRRDADAPPWLALLEARKFGGQGLEITPDLLLAPGAPLEY